MKLRASAWVALALVLFESGVASAFCRTTTCDPNDALAECEVDKNDCVTSGLPLYWASGCVTFGVQQAGSPNEGIDSETVSDITEQAFARWLASRCSDGHPSIQIGNVGPLACAESRYNENGRNANIVIFRDTEWPYPEATDTYGFTRVRFDALTGEIFDADIELNSAEFDLSADGDDGVDLASIISHEVGHFFGLSHAAPNDATSTMRASWNGDGTELRTPSADDADGLCAIYPPGRQPTTTSCEPRHGFASECNVPIDTPDEGCGFSRNRSDSSWLVLLTALFGFIVTERRRHREAFSRMTSSRTPDNR